MTSPVYSERFFAQLVPVGQTQAFGPVPAGSVWVVGSVQVQSAVSSGAYVSLNLGSGGPRLLFFDRSTGPTGVYWTGRIVLHAGETCYVQVAGGVSNVCVSGYSLSTVAGS